MATVLPTTPWTRHIVRCRAIPLVFLAIALAALALYPFSDLDLAAVDLAPHPQAERIAAPTGCHHATGHVHASCLAPAIETETVRWVRPGPVAAPLPAPVAVLTGRIDRVRHPPPKFAV